MDIHYLPKSEYFFGISCGYRIQWPCKKKELINSFKLPAF